MRVAGVHGLSDVSSASRKQNDPGGCEFGSRSTPTNDQFEQIFDLVTTFASLLQSFLSIQRRLLFALDAAPRVLSPLYLARALSGSERSSAKPRVHQGHAILGLVSVGLGAVVANIADSQPVRTTLSLNQFDHISATT
jgi:hypothetical protein